MSSFDFDVIGDTPRIPVQKAPGEKAAVEKPPVEKAVVEKVAERPADKAA